MLAQDRLVREEAGRIAAETEALGNYPDAFELYCHNTYSDRSGGFHDMAFTELKKAARLMEKYPYAVNINNSVHADVDWDYLANIWELATGGVDMADAVQRAIDMRQE